MLLLWPTEAVQVSLVCPVWASRFCYYSFELFLKLEMSLCTRSKITFDGQVTVRTMNCLSMAWNWEMQNFKPTHLINFHLSVFSILQSQRGLCHTLKWWSLSVAAWTAKTKPADSYSCTAHFSNYNISSGLILELLEAAAITHHLVRFAYQWKQWWCLNYSSALNSLHTPFKIMQSAAASAELTSHT